MIGDIGMGVLKLLTFGGCGILTIVDWFLITGKVKERTWQPYRWCYKNEKIEVHGWCTFFFLILYFYFYFFSSSPLSFL